MEALLNLVAKAYAAESNINQLTQKPTTMETQVCKKCGKELPIENFKKTRWGNYAHVCNECARKVYAENKKARKEAEKTQGLSVYTPRQLMEELARRGYEGKLTFTRVETIDITNF